jgi:hypothetical protein
MSRLLPLVLCAGLSACASLDSAFDGASDLLSPSSKSSSAANGESAADTESNAGAQANAASAGGETETAGQNEAAAANPPAAQASAAPETPAPAARNTEAAAETAESQAGAARTANAEIGEQSGEAQGEGGNSGEANFDGRRVVTVPKGGGANAEVRRRLDSLFGGSSSGGASFEEAVKESEITGVWLLEEEDGLRNCTITLTAPDKGGAVSGGAECSGLAAQVTGWGMFGNDLLLRDADNTVRARLRRSDAGWIGFTLESGIPLVMSRSG